ncbi:MAG: hybrid sensor histidine kinase/response regulator, partial [Candidatus Marinimicrobia bacterium]|nr:hybrid sensor histidine kinase/response regulator [Candidatus Neomarinimicrobiota bacterium]
GISGMVVLEEIKRIDPEIVTVVITGYATIDSAIESIKKGAYDFLTKPFTPGELRLITKRALEKRRLTIESNRLRQEKEKMREGFISMVSHQLRTPLVAVQQYFEVILGGMAGEVSDEQREMLERSKIRIDQLIYLIKDWLNLSKIDANMIVKKLASINITSIFTNIFNLMQTISKEKNITLKMDIPEDLPKISGDKGTLEQAFLNLVDNGIRYGKDGGSLIVSAKEENGYIEVSISDNGIGIPEDKLPFIFEQFYQVEPKSDSTGLGLSIVKRIMDAHSATIKVTSKPEKGSTFTVLLTKSEEEK